MTLFKKLALPLLMIVFIIVGIILFGYGASTNEKTVELKKQTENNVTTNESVVSERKEKVKIIPNEFKNAENLANQVIAVQSKLTEITWKNSRYNPISFETTQYKDLVKQMRSLMIKSTDERFAANAWATEPSWEMKLLKATKTSSKSINVAFAYYTTKGKLAQVTTAQYDIEKKVFKLPNTYRTAIGYNTTIDNQIRGYDDNILENIEKED